jgi:two-component system, NtrC family, sensor histidine kinase PilS
VVRQEADLANLAELNAQIIARMGSGVIAVAPNGNIRSINETARRLLPQRAGSTLQDLSPSLATLLETWRSESGHSGLRQVPGDTEQAELEVRLAPLGMQGEQGTLLILENASEIKRRAHAAKLQSIGRLTASIAHEIRNPLGAISHSAQLLAESLNLDKSDQRLLDIIQKQSHRVDDVIRNVLNLSRGRSAERQLLHLEERLLRFADEFCTALQIPRDSLHVSVSPEDSWVLFDPSHLNQILWNLCMNARLHAGHHRPDSPPIILRGGAGQIRRTVSLDVIDHGSGVPVDQQEHLFEPFASNAPGGTGLGLYLARLLCEDNGAAIDYVDQPQGGCFRILFGPAENPTPDQGTM